MNIMMYHLDEPNGVHYVAATGRCYRPANAAPRNAIHHGVAS
jgi:hypothetical protein